MPITRSRPPCSRSNSTASASCRRRRWLIASRSAGYSSNGGTAFSDLLTAQSSLRGAELSLLQAQNTASQAYVSLTAAIGREPD